MPRSSATPTPSRSSACAAPGSPASTRRRQRSRSAPRRRSRRSAARSPFLRDAIESIASPTIRNMATVGGNLFVPAAARRPRGLPARARRAGHDRRRRRLARGRRRRRRRGLVTSVSFKVARAVVLHEGDAPQAELARRSSPSPPTASGSRSAASPREPVRAHAAEAALAGTLDREHVEAAAAAAVEAADPFDDAYASAWYRRRVLPVHVRRALLGE